MPLSANSVSFYSEMGQKATKLSSLNRTYVLLFKIGYLEKGEANEAIEVSRRKTEMGSGGPHHYPGYRRAFEQRG